MKKTIETKRTSITEYIPKYACEVCNQIFSSAYDALDHEKNHYIAQSQYVFDKQLYYIKTEENAIAFTKCFYDKSGDIDWQGEGWYFIEKTTDYGPYSSEIEIANLFSVKTHLKALRLEIQELEQYEN